MIFARSPFIVTINELSQESTRLELFIWNGTGSAPATPTYSLSKKVPSINNLATYYNISPFLREYFDFTQSDPTVVGTEDPTDIYAYCNVTYKRYYTLDGVETLLDTTTDKAFDGYGLFENGSNYAGQRIFLSDRSLAGGSNTYYYPCSTQTTDAYNSSLLNPAGLTLLTGAAGTNNYWQCRYTNLRTGATQSFNIGINSMFDVVKVRAAYIPDGNKLEILNGSSVVQATFYFVPQCECKYEIFTCDFINRWGAWQREFFYKASTESIEMENNKFKANPVPFPAYNTKQAQYQTFNTNGKRSYKLNTGWVEENYKVTLEEMLFSETIRINGLPATLRTKSVEKFKSINTKTINYQMEFEMAYDVINTIS